MISFPGGPQQSSSAPLIRGFGSSQPSGVVRGSFGNASQQFSGAPLISGFGSSQPSSAPVISGFGSSQPSSAPLISGFGSSQSSSAPLISGFGSSQSSSAPVISGFGSSQPSGVAPGSDSSSSCVPVQPPSKPAYESCAQVRPVFPFSDVESTDDITYEQWMEVWANNVEYFQEGDTPSTFQSPEPTGFITISGTVGTNLNNPNPNNVWTQEVPTISLPGGKLLYRGTSTPCKNSKTQFAFNKSVWWGYDPNNDAQAEYDTANQYTGDTGCLTVYQVPPEGMTFLDFWDWTVIGVVLFWIFKKKLTQREIDVFAGYTGYGLKKDTVTPQPDRGEGAVYSELMSTMWNCGLLDDDYQNEENFYRTRAPLQTQYDKPRRIVWGKAIHQFDHSSMRKMDQEFSTLLDKIFNKQRIGEFRKQFDGVIIPFSTPSTMHGAIHTEFFTFPCKAKKFVHLDCRQCSLIQRPGEPPTKVCSDELTGCAMQQGAKRRKTRGQKKNRSVKLGLKTRRQKKNRLVKLGLKTRKNKKGGSEE